MKACRLLNFAYVANEDIDSIREQCDKFLPYLSFVQKKRAHDLSKQTSMIIESIKFNAQKYKNAAIAYKIEYDEKNFNLTTWWYTILHHKSYVVSILQAAFFLLHEH